MNDWIVPAWSAPANVRARVTTRAGGVSVGPWRGLNLGDHVGDDPAAVAENRRRVSLELPAEPVWLKQVHGADCVDAATVSVGHEADAAFSRASSVVCAVMTADCLPVLLCDSAGRVVAAVHAGWRGLAAGVIESTVSAMGVVGADLHAWLGPAIRSQSFEVGGEVRDIFAAQNADAVDAFVARPNGKWLCDIYRLARQRLAGLGVCRITSADFCTVRDADRFYSYRAEGVTGRFASLIWLE
jgi:YfiH family protein